MSKEKDIEVVPLSPRIHINEFLAGTDLTRVQKAGFTAFVAGKVLMRPEEWEQKLAEYTGK